MCDETQDTEAVEILPSEWLDAGQERKTEFCYDFFEDGWDGSPETT
jgi:hypothetical protein